MTEKKPASHKETGLENTRTDYNPSTTPADIQRVIVKASSLTYQGFRRDSDTHEAFNQLRAKMLTDDFLLQVETARLAIDALRPRRDGFSMTGCGSYALKHWAEIWRKREMREELSAYVSNGALIVAAILEGWEPVRVFGPNCEFKRGAK